MSELLVNATAAGISNAKSNFAHIKGLKKSSDVFLQTLTTEGLKNAATTKGAKPMYKFAGQVMDKIV